jgi:hypothetical protein
MVVMRTGAAPVHGFTFDVQDVYLVALREELKGAVDRR